MDFEDIMEYFVVGFAVLFAVALIGFLCALNNHSDDRYNSWAAQCRKDGGQVTTWSVGDDECVKDGNIIDHVN